MSIKAVSDDANSQESMYLPWLEEKNWHNGQIYSSARNRLYFSWIFSLFWNVIAFPIAYLAIRDNYPELNFDHFDPVLLVLLFPVVGIGLLFWAVQNYRQWSAFGRLALTLDPYPGSIGGEVGGFLELPIAWRSGYDFTVTVNCIHHSIRSSGKNSSHHQDVVWKNFAAVEYEPSASGIRLKFKCPVDDGLYESEDASGRNYYRWIVHIKGKDNESRIELDREFDIPVFKRQSPQKSHLHVSTTAPEVTVDEISEQQVQINRTAHSLQLFYPRSRNSGVAWGLLIIALIFSAVTGFLVFETWSGVQQDRSFSLFSAGITGLMSLVFGIVSLFMLGFAVHLLSNQLRVKIDPNGILVNSRSLLHHWEKLLQFSDIRAIDKNSNMSTGQGSSAIRYFTLTAYLHDNQKLTLGNGIKGQLAAESLLKLIQQQIKALAGTKTTLDSVAKTSPLSATGHAQKAAQYIKAIKIVINIVGFLIMLFLLLKFFVL